ncbi:hypothetical protein [Siphonobacter aquaeclarae]|uniref:hypothetical protein n=1 Tax=Siphonobacter aquaeclarae TaxID=563176 RepID=UPI000B88AFCD|nr:hypothetical protein [Siphonobacter aquaeclarae]
MKKVSFPEDKSWSAFRLTEADFAWLIPFLLSLTAGYPEDLMRATLQTVTKAVGMISISAAGIANKDGFFPGNRGQRQKQGKEKRIHGRTRLKKGGPQSRPQVS